MARTRTPEPHVLGADEFINIFKKSLPQPLLSAPPHAHVTRAEKARAARRDDHELVPERSARLAAKSKSRAPRPEAQARKVMMKRLGVEVETQLPDEAPSMSSRRRSSSRCHLQPGKPWRCSFRAGSSGLAAQFAPPRCIVPTSSFS